MEVEHAPLEDYFPLQVQPGVFHLNASESEGSSGYLQF